MASLRELTWKADAKGFDKVAKDVSKLDDAVDKTKSKMGGLDTTLKDMGTKLQKQGKDITSFGKKWMKVTAPITAVGVAGLKMSMDLDTAIRQVSTLTDEGIMPIKQLKEDIKEISSESGIAQKEIANSMYEALSSGVDQTKIAEFTKSAINLTEAGFTDMTTAIDATTTVLNAYGDAAYDVTKIHDIMVKTQDKGKITVDQLGQNIGRVIPAASNLGVNLDQLGASYSMLTAKGQNPQIATTNLNALFNELGKSGSKVDKVLKQKLGKNFKDLTKDGKSVGDVLGILNEEAKASGESLSDMFGSMNAGNAALTLLSEGTEGYNKLMKEMQESDGVAAENAAKMAGPAKEVKKAFNETKIAMTELGAAMSPYVIKVANGVKKVVEKFNSLDDATKSSIVQWGAIVVAIGPAITAFGVVTQVVGVAISVLGTLVSVGGTILGVFGSIAGILAGPLAAAFSFILSPIGLLVGAIVGLIAIGVNLYRNWETVKARAEELGGGIGGYLRAMVEQTGSAFSGLKDKAVSALDAVKGRWESLKEAVKHPITAVVNIFEKRNASKNSAAVGSLAVDGIHKSGINNIPFDDYIGRLHQGEMVLPAETAARYRELGGDIHNIPSSGGSNSTFAPTINVSVSGGADSEVANNIGQVVRDEMEDMFRNMRLQRV